MKNTLKAIELAVKEGFRKEIGFIGVALERDIPELLLDPAFWVALGKGLGWRDVVGGCGECFLRGFSAPKDCKTCEVLKARWFKEATRYFTDYAMAGKDCEAFFTSILEKRV